MSNLSVRAAQELGARALRLEKRAEKDKMSTQQTLGLLAFGGSQTIASPVMGYLVGRFDAKDGVVGDGVKVVGMPVFGVIGAVVSGVGFAIGGPLGLGVAGLGKAALDGELFLAGMRHGALAVVEAERKKAIAEE